MATVLGGIEARRVEWLGGKVSLPTLSLQSRAALLFAAGLFSIGFLAWFATDQAASVSSDPAIPLRAAADDTSRLLTAMSSQDSALRGYAATGDAAYLGLYEPGRAQVLSAEEQLRNDLGSEYQAEVAAAEAAAAEWMRWAEDQRQTVAGGGPGLAPGVLEHGRQLFANFSSRQTALAASVQGAADGAEAQASQRRHADAVGMALTASCAVVTLLLLIHLLLFQVVRPIWQLAVAAAALAREGDAEVEHTSRRDEIGALAHALLDWRYASAERLAMAKLAAESEARFRTVFDHAPIGVCRLSIKGRILDTNPTLQQMLGYSAVEMARLSIGDLSHPDDRARLQELQDHRVDRFVIERRYLRRDGSVFWGLMTVALARMQDGRPLFYVAMVEDITERKDREHNLHERATKDSLTGLANRTSFLEALQVTLTDRRIHRSAVFMLDLDGFKPVNDTLGHAAGDDLLRQVARRLFVAMRTSDVVARLGGDEFAILLPNTDAQGADVAARKVLTELAQPFTVAGRRVRVAGSVGIALTPDHGLTVEELLERADLAMYCAKRSGSGLAVAAA